jgi:hypothetical protein
MAFYAERAHGISPWEDEGMKIADCRFEIAD